MNQVTVKKKTERVRDIENIAEKKWIRDEVGGTALITSSSAQPSAGLIPGLRIPQLERVGSLGLFRWKVGSVGDMTSPWVST